MHKVYITALLLFGLSTAKAVTVVDSIGVENHNGKKLIIHQTTAKETYYSIARRYNVSPKEIMSFNDNKYLQIGVIIKVPTDLPFVSNTAATVKNTTNEISEYLVKPKDNLNQIAEKHGITLNELKAYNNLTSNNLNIGQVLKIPVKTETKPTQSSGDVVKTVTEQVPNLKKTEALVQKLPEQNQDQKVIEHTVKAQEYLNKIAEDYGTTAAQIKSLNNLTSSNLRIGQKLKIVTQKNIDGQEDSKPVVENPNNTGITEKNNSSSGIHTVKTGETIFSIAQQYSITAYQIRVLNNLSDNVITVGQTLKIPSGVIVDISAKGKEIIAAKPATDKIVKPKQDEFTHTVVKGENIFLIAQKYGLTAYQIREANNLTDNTININQKLIIPKTPEPKSVNDLSKLNQEETADSTKTLSDPKLRREASVYGLNQTEEKGAATWISDPDLDSSKMLVLHRTLPVGRVIKITNPMTNRTTFAKVVGKFTENESTKDIILVMTKAVAESLGALDKRFFCSLVY